MDISALPRSMMTAIPVLSRCRALVWASLNSAHSDASGVGFCAV